MTVFARVRFPTALPAGTTRIFSRRGGGGDRSFTLQYSPGKAASGWVGSFLAGEGVVLKFTGQGRIYVQSHNPKEFGSTLGPMLPPRE